eukprot:Clim_evm3s34 gene=Clim_evmTU3s34
MGNCGSKTQEGQKQYTASQLQPTKKESTAARDRKQRASEYSLQREDRGRRAVSKRHVDVYEIISCLNPGIVERFLYRAAVLLNCSVQQKDEIQPALVSLVHGKHRFREFEVRSSMTEDEIEPETPLQVKFGETDPLVTKKEEFDELRETADYPERCLPKVSEDIFHGRARVGNPAKDSRELIEVGVILNDFFSFKDIVAVPNVLSAQFSGVRDSIAVRDVLSQLPNFARAADLVLLLDELSFRGCRTRLDPEIAQSTKRSEFMWHHAFRLPLNMESLQDNYPGAATVATLIDRIDIRVSGADSNYDLVKIAFDNVKHRIALDWWSRDGKAVWTKTDAKTGYLSAARDLSLLPLDESLKIEAEVAAHLLFLHVPLPKLEFIAKADNEGEFQVALTDIRYGPLKFLARLVGLGFMFQTWMDDFRLYVGFHEADGYHNLTVELFMAAPTFIVSYIFKKVWDSLIEDGAFWDFFQIFAELAQALTMDVREAREDGSV